MISHPVVQQVVEDYLTIIDAQAPGLVEALYLVGSTAFDDFQPGRSDVDFIAVSRNSLSVSDFAAVKRAHAILRSRHRKPHFDGSYLTWRELAKNPEGSGKGADVHHGKTEFPASGRRTPIIWLELATAGISVRGPRRQDIAIWTDRTVAREWAHRRMIEHWRPWPDRARPLWTWQGLRCLGAAAPARAVLSVSQLHHVLTTGGVVSKTEAGRYGLQTFGPRWQRLLHECLRIRLRGAGPAGYRNPLTRRAEAIDFVRLVSATAIR